MNVEPELRHFSPEDLAALERILKRRLPELESVERDDSGVRVNAFGVEGQYGCGVNVPLEHFADYMATAMIGLAEEKRDRADDEAIESGRTTDEQHAASILRSVQKLITNAVDHARKLRQVSSHPECRTRERNVLRTAARAFDEQAAILRDSLPEMRRRLKARQSIVTSEEALAGWHEKWSDVLAEYDAIIRA